MRWQKDTRLTKICNFFKLFIPSLIDDHRDDDIIQKISKMIVAFQLSLNLFFVQCGKKIFSFPTIETMKTCAGTTGEYEYSHSAIYKYN